MQTDTILKALEQVVSSQRLAHSMRVAQCAKQLASVHGVKQQDAYLAGLIHDMAKDMQGHYKDIVFTPYLDRMYQEYPAVWHAFAQPHVTRILCPGLPDHCLQAAIWHTTGKAVLSALEQCVFIADFIEPNRQCSERLTVEKVAFDTLDRATFLIAHIKLRSLVQQKQAVFPALIACYNAYL